MNEPELIKSIFVVEGKNDREKLLKCGIPYVVITDGYNVSRETVEHLQVLEKKHTIVILTDPDGPGRKISERLQRVLSAPRILLVPKGAANGKKEVGIEYVSLALLQEITAPYTKEKSKTTSDLTYEDLLQYPLSGPGSKETKAKVITHYKLISASLKKLYVQLLLLDVTKSDLERVIHG